ncbi:MAG: acetate--CoA ligase [Myxococcales bacterium]|nr:acetate--CoA ligase [Myxococcales bacterium]MCB9576485.1 acetate--CoA ligase [Polyangiaceae bacterium]
MADDTSIGTFSAENRRFEPSDAFRKQARISSREQYDTLYRESLESPETFWKRETAELVFDKPWTTLTEGALPHVKWFLGAELNVTKSCLDRHLSTPVKDKRAIVWESEPGETETLTYAELHDKVVRFSAALRNLGVKKGDRVAIYMGMVPEVVVGMLACARIGAAHSVVFGGFAAESLRDRINDCGAKVVLTQDGAWRRGHVVPLKATVDKALESAPSVEKVVVFRRLGDEHAKIEMRKGRDVDWYEAEKAADPAQGQAEIVDAEHPLFILYTSGSTGKPKGVLHTTAGYLAGTHVTSKYVFDLREDDVYWCTADVGWITGHSYIVYGPLSNGATCVMYEGAPNFPDWGRFWQLIDKHQVTILYTAPTAIRAFIRAGTDWVDKSDLSSLRLLGTVGEPINPEAWIWYHENVGKERCPIVDTWWQTETGAIMLTTLPGAAFAKPGSTGLPFFGVEPAVVTGDGKSVGDNEGGLLVVRRSWPSMLRTIYGDDDRFVKQYFSEIRGNYFTGDGARRDEDGYFHVVGRIDDVLNVAGHRIGTAEIESALVAHKSVAEAAAVGRPDDIKGQALVVFVTLKPGFAASPELANELRAHVGQEIGKFAAPDTVRFAESLPKTRSGKIMRRLLKDIAAGREAQGDISTLEDLNVLAKLQADE